MTPTCAGDRAAAVGGEQVVAADAVLASGVLVADERRDARRVLRELEQLVVEADPAGGELLGARLQQRLEPDLRQVELVPGARGAPVLVVACGAPALELGDPPAVVRVRAREAGVERAWPTSASAGVLRSAIASATPASSRISIVRWFSTWALGSSEVVGSALTSSVSTPRPASSIDAVRPAPPPPTIRTGTVSSGARGMRRNLEQIWMAVKLLYVGYPFRYDHAMSAKVTTRRPGRPKAEESPASVDAMLSAALRAFATHGYDGVSVNALGRDLGVSHNLLHQRFGSKEGLWYAAVDWGFGGMANELVSAVDPTLTDPLDQLRLIIRRFLQVSAERPELVGLMNLEGRESSERLTYLYDYYVEPLTAPIGRLLEHLAADGRIRPISGRAFHFLVAHGAAAPFTVQALAREFDPTDPFDPAERDAHIDLVIEVILAGIQLDPPRVARAR